MVVMPNCENDSGWLNENLPEFACRLCCCKLEQAVGAELADVTDPEQGNMFKTELYEVIKLKQRKFKGYKPNNLLTKPGNSVPLAKRSNSVPHPLPHPEFNPMKKVLAVFKNCAVLHNVTFSRQTVRCAALGQFLCSDTEVGLRDVALFNVFETNI